MAMLKVPSLVDLCVQVAIKYVRYLGDVGETDYHLLDRILSHCTLDQLKHIEDCTERDLSPVTDKLWKSFYKAQFGVESTNVVVERMKQKKVTFKWKQLFEAKVEEREEATQKSLDRIRQRYKEEDARKQSRQVKLCTKAPPSSKKRTFFGGAIANNIYNTKSSLLKKAKIDYVNSHEFKNLSVMNNKTIQRRPSEPSPIRKPVAATALSKPSPLPKPSMAATTAVTKPSPLPLPLPKPLMAATTAVTKPSPFPKPSPVTKLAKPWSQRR
ncbi:uncharacterized protein LOC127253951 [Andrographis paniculata]|uniref:uncharacterized protein LOC127253951 n=1 Tax=Andrographis paniculata TaxID=175694 RepID=UPI0021E95D7E|nr:uncharacterized protein LOC127253951 [Andrographis paniculata]